MKKINFTKEHEIQLEQIAVKLLFAGKLVKGNLGTMYSVHDVLHNITTQSIITLHGGTKNQIKKIEEMDEWSVSEYQQRKLAGLKDLRDFLNLAIGWKKFQAQRKENITLGREIAAKVKHLREQQMTPEDQLKGLIEEYNALDLDESIE